MTTAAAKLVVLTPYTGAIDPGCEQGLAALERRGYVVRRAPGFSAIDFGRTVLANTALRDGFDEILWIYSDIAFEPDDVEKLRKIGKSGTFRVLFHGKRFPVREKEP